MISQTLKDAVAFCGPNIGFTAKYMSAQSLCLEGSILLICAIIESNIIKMIGLWSSDDMLWYLHVKADSAMWNITSLVASHGTWNLLPTQEEPCYWLPTQKDIPYLSPGLPMEFGAYETCPEKLHTDQQEDLTVKDTKGGGCQAN